MFKNCLDETSFDIWWWKIFVYTRNIPNTTYHLQWLIQYTGSHNISQSYERNCRWARVCLNIFKMLKLKFLNQFMTTDKNVHTCRNMIFGLREPCLYHRKLKTWHYWKFHLFTVKVVIFRFFWQFFNTTLVILEISVACYMSFYAIFSPTILMEIRTYHFRAPWFKGGQFFNFLKVNFRGPMQWELCLFDITMACFSLTKTMEIRKFHFRTTIAPGGYFFTFWSIFMGPMKGDW